MGHASVAYQRKRGNFSFGADGLLDWDEVKANWQTTRPAKNQEATRREQNAKITSTVVKANFLKVRLAHIDRSYIESNVSRETLKAEVDRFLMYVAQAGEGSAPALALAFDLTQADAEAIMMQVTGIVLDEIGDLYVETERMMEEA
jgi:hypothetical protein